MPRIAPGRRADSSGRRRPPCRRRRSTACDSAGRNSTGVPTRRRPRRPALQCRCPRGPVLECAEKARRRQSRVPSDPAQDEYRRNPRDGGEDGAVPDHECTDQDDQWYQQVAAPLQRFQHGRLAFPDLGEEPELARPKVHHGENGHEVDRCRRSGRLHHVPVANAQELGQDEGHRPHDRRREYPTG